MKELIRVMFEEARKPGILKAMFAIVIGIISFFIPFLLIRQICSNMDICLIAGCILGVVLVWIEILIYNIKSRQKEYSCSIAEAYKIYKKDSKCDECP